MPIVPRKYTAPSPATPTLADAVKELGELRKLLNGLGITQAQQEACLNNLAERLGAVEGDAGTIKAIQENQGHTLGRMTGTLLVLSNQADALGDLAKVQDQRIAALEATQATPASPAAPAGKRK